MYDVLALVGITGLISLIFGYVGMYFALKNLENKGFFTDIFENFIYSASENSDLQVEMYKIGAIVGNGIKQGVGLDVLGKNPTKLKMKDLGAQVIASLIGGVLNPSAGNPNLGRNPPNSTPKRPNRPSEPPISR